MPPKQRKHYRVFTPGCTTRGEAGSERRGESRKEDDERIEYRGRKRWRARRSRGGARGEDTGGQETRGGVRQTFRENCRKHRWQVREVNKKWLRHHINPTAGTKHILPPAWMKLIPGGRKVQTKTNDSQRAERGLQTWVSHIVTH